MGLGIPRKVNERLAECETVILTVSEKKQGSGTNKASLGRFTVAKQAATMLGRGIHVRHCCLSHVLTHLTATD